MSIFGIFSTKKIPLKSYFDFSVIYYIKSSVVALFSVKPMFSVNSMSVKVMQHCICFLGVVRNIHCLFYMGPVGHSKSNLEKRIPYFCLIIFLL